MDCKLFGGGTIFLVWICTALSTWCLTRAPRWYSNTNNKLFTWGCFPSPPQITVPLIINSRIKLGKVAISSLSLVLIFNNKDCMPRMHQHRKLCKTHGSRDRHQNAQIFIHRGKSIQKTYKIRYPFLPLI